MNGIALLVCSLLGLTAMPLGLLPSVLLFTDVANGTDTSARRKAAYNWTVWVGLFAAWLLAAGTLYAVFAALHG